MCEKNKFFVFYNTPSLFKAETTMKKQSLAFHIKNLVKENALTSLGFYKFYKNIQL